MADSLWMRLREVAWDTYPCSASSKKSIPKILENLSSRKEARAMKASHDLWLALCSGGISQAAKPSLPFLIEIFDISSDNVQEELLDVFIKLCDVPHDEQADGWQKNIYAHLQSESLFFQGLLHSRNETLIQKTQLLLTKLEDENI